MTSIAKFLIAALGAVLLVVQAVAGNHGWAGLDWAPIATAVVTALGVYAYPNTAAPPKGAPGP